MSDKKPESDKGEITECKLSRVVVMLCRGGRRVSVVTGPVRLSERAGKCCSHGDGYHVLPYISLNYILIYVCCGFDYLGFIMKIKKYLCV